MIHETGHAVTAILTGGRVESISLFSNTGGLAITRHRSVGGRILTLLSGYPAASLFSVFIIYGLTQDWYEQLAMVLAVILVYNLLFWVRNAVGWVWVLSVLASLYFIYTNGFMSVFEHVLTLIGGVIVIQAFLSTWIIFVISIKDRHSAGDAALLEKETKVPSFIWGFLFLFQGTVSFALALFIWFGGDLYLIVEILNYI